MSRIVITGSTGALVPFLVPIYPRVRCTARPDRYLINIHSADISSYSPYYRLRSAPFPSVSISAASRALHTTTMSRSLRTMPDPVQRTASPYHDPTVKGPKSQQLSSGLSHSLLQTNKSKPPQAPGAPNRGVIAFRFFSSPKRTFPELVTKY